MSQFDLRELRNAFGTFPTGVTVVTAMNKDGLPVGFTANSYTSVSLDPPLILVCPAQTLASYEVFASCQHFAVNVLAGDQQDIANIFASFPDDRFAQVSWHKDAAGCPLLEGVAATFSCVAHERVTAGDHIILIGRIEHFTSVNKEGLGYSNSGYFSLGLERQAAELPRPRHPVRVGAIVEHGDKVLLLESHDGLNLPNVTATSRTGSLAAIRRHLAKAGLEVEFGPVYSIIESQRTGMTSTFYRAIAPNGNPHGLGRYIPVEEMPAGKFATPALGNMMKRYALERHNGVFGLYVGNEYEGDVHMFGEGLPE